jgi:hypothetical protein
LVHQVVLFHGCFLSAGQTDSRCVVDQHINTSKSLDNLLNALLDVLLVSDVTHQWQGLAADCLDLFGGCVNGAL